MELKDINKEHAFVMVGGKALIINELKGWDRVEDVTFSSISDFKARYEPHTIPIRDEKGNTKQESIARHWLRWKGRRSYRGVKFEPGAEHDYRYNLWQGFPQKPEKGNWSLFRDHIYHVLARRVDEISNYLLAWMARLIQKPGEKPGTSIVLLGPQGTGKGVFARHFGQLFQPHFLHIAHPEQFIGRFNSHLATCSLAFLDEAIWERAMKRVSGMLKALITEPRLVMERKYHDPLMVDNHVNLIISSNSEWSVPAGFNERRFLVLNVSSEHMRDYPYFKAIKSQMENGGYEALMHDLLNMDISGFNLREVPRTDALVDQILHGMTPTQRWWFECLARGYVYARSLEEDRPKEEFYQTCVEYHKNKRMRPPDASAFWKELYKLCPSLKSPEASYRPRKNNESRKTYLHLPPCSQCRMEFENAVGSKITWADFR